MAKNFSDFLDYVAENNISVEPISVEIDLNKPETLQDLVNASIKHNSETTLRLLAAYHDWLNTD